MPTFKPVVFKTKGGYEYTVACLHDVINVVAMSWPNKECEKYRKAAQLAEMAKQGWCAPVVAYQAFVDAARAQKRIVEPRPLHERVVQELSAIDEEHFILAPMALQSPCRTRRITRSRAPKLASRPQP